MSKWIPRVAISGFICCLLYFIVALADLILSKSGTINPLMNPGVKDYKAWLSNPIRPVLGLSQDILFPIIWIHVLFFLRKFREYLFIVVAVGFYMLWVIYNSFFNPKLGLYNANTIITIAVILIFVASLWFVKHPYLKGFTRSFTLALFVRIMIPALFGWLYDHIGFRWLLINPIIPGLLPFSVLIMMFLSIWVRSRYNVPPIEEPIEPKL